MLFRGRSRWASALLLFIAVGSISTIGCSDGSLSGEPKKYEGGGPLPEFKGVEAKEKPISKPKGR